MDKEIKILKQNEVGEININGGKELDLRILQISRGTYSTAPENVRIIPHTDFGSIEEFMYGERTY